MKPHRNSLLVDLQFICKFPSVQTCVCTFQSLATSLYLRPMLPQPGPRDPSQRLRVLRETPSLRAPPDPSMVRPPGLTLCFLGHRWFLLWRKRPKSSQSPQGWRRPGGVSQEPCVWHELPGRCRWVTFPKAALFGSQGPVGLLPLPVDLVQWTVSSECVCTPGASAELAVPEALGPVG